MSWERVSKSLKSVGQRGFQRLLKLAKDTPINSIALIFIVLWHCLFAILYSLLIYFTLAPDQKEKLTSATKYVTSILRKSRKSKVESETSSSPIVSPNENIMCHQTLPTCDEENTVNASVNGTANGIL